MCHIHEVCTARVGIVVLVCIFLGSMDTMEVKFATIEDKGMDWLVWIEVSFLLFVELRNP